MLVLEQLELAIAADRRVLVPRARTVHLSGGQFQDADPHRYEHLRFVLGTQRIVCPHKNLGGTDPEHRKVLDDRLGDHHKECRGHALVAYICDDNPKMVVVNHKEVVEVSAYFLRRIHAGIQVELLPGWKCGKDRGKHARLNFGCHIELGLCGRELAALVVEYDAVHDDQRHEHHAVLGRVSKRTKREGVIYEWQEYERQGSRLLVAWATAPHDEYAGNK